MFADNGLEEDDHPTRLYFPADAGQMKACVKAVFQYPGLRFIFSTRSKVPNLLAASGENLYGDGHVLEPGSDEVVRDGSAGTIVSFGDGLYRALDAVERLQQEGIELTLINKATLKVVEKEMSQQTLTLAEIGKQVGASRERIRQVESRALCRLRNLN